MLKGSILLSIYHREKPSYLELALNSIIRSSEIISEVVIVKDGLIPKELSDVLNEFKLVYEGTVKVIGYSKNKGLGFALNYGLKHCSNEIVFRVDGDDVSRTDRFSIQYSLLISNPHLSIVGGQIEEFDKSPGDIGRLRTVPISSADIKNIIKLRNPFNHMTVAFRKSHVESVGGYMEMPGYEDYFLWFRLLENQGTGMNVKNILVDARIGNNMLGRRRGINMFLREVSFQKSLFQLKFLSQFELFRNLLLRAVPRLFPRFILEFLYHKKLRK